jgi:hypothetical protein
MTISDLWTTAQLLPLPRWERVGVRVIERRLAIPHPQPLFRKERGELLSQPLHCAGRAWQVNPAAAPRGTVVSHRATARPDGR